MKTRMDVLLDVMADSTRCWMTPSLLEVMARQGGGDVRGLSPKLHSLEVFALPLLTYEAIICQRNNGNVDLVLSQHDTEEFDVATLARVDPTSKADVKVALLVSEVTDVGQRRAAAAGGNFSAVDLSKVPKDAFS